MFKIQYLTIWNDEKPESEAKHVDWIRKLYSYMSPYVSTLPREAYVFYRDLDLEMNRNGSNLRLILMISSDMNRAFLYFHS
ncbi:hypothetical protein ACS0TY_018050 [Phlomoides rotata]